jgi:8-oxo-dGTP pyrophosphatase MutT (NUDIX family)/phosphohistidine phosphatase SixA
MSPATTLRAAGGVVWRRADPEVEIALVHRPRYDDWTLPKGKLEPGEELLDAAVREVGEEMGAQVEVSRRVGRVRYAVEDGRKTVTFWAMRCLREDFRPDREVDAVQWLPWSAARRALSYETDRQVVDDFVSVPVPDSVVVLLRHARAGKRSEWNGEDALRPLDPSGERQAERLGALLRYFRPRTVYAADRTRCIQTVQPLAARTDLQVVVEPVFADESFIENPGATETALLSLAKPGRVSVVCSQGTAIPALIDRLGQGMRSSDTRKGAFWVLSFVDGDVVAADYYDPPER